MRLRTILWATSVAIAAAAPAQSADLRLFRVGVVSPYHGYYRGSRPSPLPCYDTYPFFCGPRYVRFGGVAIFGEPPDLDGYPTYREVLAPRGWRYRVHAWRRRHHIRRAVVSARG